MPRFSLTIDKRYHLQLVIINQSHSVKKIKL